MRRAELERRIQEVIDDSGLPGIVAVYLFGSFAEGREHQESDVDIGVLMDRNVLPSARDRFEQRLGLSSALSEVKGRSADVVILNDAPPTFSRMVVTTGIRILCRDDEAEHAFVRDVQLQAPDLVAFVQRTRATKLEALAKR